MVKHKYIFNHEQGGYFFRIYPKLQPPFRASFRDEDLFSNLPKDIYNPEPEYKGSVRREFHGRFQTKDEDWIELLTEATILLTDEIINESEQRKLYSIIRLQVPKNIFSYKFEVDKSYIINPNKVIEL